MGIRRMNKIPNARIRQLCRVTKGLDEKINEGVLRWFAVWKEWRTTRVLRRECAGSRSVGRPRWIDTVKDCLKKRGLDVRQARIMVHDRSVWREFVRGNA